MKLIDLRNTILILGGILLGTFLISGWWVSREVAVLKEARQALQQTLAAHEEAKSKLAELRDDRDHLELDCEIIQKSIEVYKTHVRACREYFPPPAILRAQHGFKKIQELVAKGEYAGLALTDGYIELTKFFSSQEFQLLANDFKNLSGLNAP